MSEELTGGGSESRRARQIAEEYRQRGYEVSLEPSPASLPPFLEGYRPDIVARSSEETVVVEVTSAGAYRLHRSPDSGSSPHERMAAIVRALREQPGWRFELALVNPPLVPEPEAPIAERQSLTKLDAERAIADAEDLTKSGRREAALLWSWSAAEAMLRLLASAEGVSTRRNDPPYLLKQLAQEGSIPGEDYETLMSAFRARNAVAHGFQPGQGIVLDALLPELLGASTRLIHLLPNTQPA